MGWLDLMGRLSPDPDSNRAADYDERAQALMRRELGADITYQVVVCWSQPSGDDPRARIGNFRYFGPFTRGQADDFAWQVQLLPLGDDEHRTTTVHPLEDGQAFLAGL